MLQGERVGRIGEVSVRDIVFRRSDIKNFLVVSVLRIVFLIHSTIHAKVHMVDVEGIDIIENFRVSPESIKRRRGIVI